MDINHVLAERIISEYLKGTDCDEVLSALFEERFTWDGILGGMLSVLLRPHEDKALYQYATDMLWCAMTDGNQLEGSQDVAVALLYARLGDEKAPYENNTLWSIVAEVNHLDYANSEYNPLKDEAILQVLKRIDLNDPGEAVYCEKCGSRMAPIGELGALGMTCPNCGWGWVTTDPDFFDTNRYSVEILKVADPGPEAIKAVSKACGCNYIEAKDRLFRGYRLEDCSADDRERIEEFLRTGKVGYGVTVVLDH